MAPKTASLVVALAIAVLATAGIASSMVSTGGGARVIHVYGGGRVGPGTFPSGNLTFPGPRDLSVDAHASGAAISGHLYYGNNEAANLIFGGDVTCLTVRGNRAAVGGVIREGGDPATVDYGFVIFLADNGSPASSTRDQSSAAYIDPLSAPEWPRGFPHVCPDPNGAFNTDGYLDLHSGDIVVEG